MTAATIDPRPGGPTPSGGRPRALPPTQDSVYDDTFGSGPFAADLSGPGLSNPDLSGPHGFAPAWFCPDEPFDPDPFDPYDDPPPMSRIDALEWELWGAIDQDEAEREMLRQKAPPWVFLPPGAELAAALETVRPQYESPIATIELMKAARRLESWAASLKADAIASFWRQRKSQALEIPRPETLDSSGRPVDPERSWTAEIAAALQLAPMTATKHIDTALHLTGTLTNTRAALRCGALTWSKALSISETTRELPREAAQAVESHVLRRASGQTHRNLRASLRRQVAKHTSRDANDRHRAAAAERTCKIVPLPNGMAGLWVVHTADKIQQMWVVLQAIANLAKRPTPNANANANATADTQLPHQTGDDSAAPHRATTESAAPHRATTESAAPRQSTNDPATPKQTRDEPSALHQPNDDSPTPHRTSDHRAAPDQPKDQPTAPQRRADVMADLFEQILHNGLDWLERRLPDQHRRRPHIEVLIPINTLLGLDDDPCELTGYGPIPADMARRIAGDGTWRRLLTDPTNGTILEASTTRHDPGTMVTETLLARHPVCAWPGCNRTSRECDRDHTTPFAQTGQTTLTGLVPYCEYHHVIKDTPAWGWKTTAHPDGSVTLTTPTGHRYTTVPPARGPIRPSPTSTGGDPPHDPPPF